MEKIKAIVFDLDGTLIDREKAFLKFCDYLIEKYTPLSPYEGEREALVNYMIEIDANGYGGLHNFIPKLLKMWNFPLTTEAFIEERNEIFGQFSETVPMLDEVLTTLKSKYKLGMITNGCSYTQRAKITKVGIAHYFDDIIVSGEELFAKPDPRIFLLSCEHLDVKPEEIIYVGDYYPNDIVGAMNAGIKSIWITEDTEEKNFNSIKIVKLQELLQIL